MHAATRTIALPLVAALLLAAPWSPRAAAAEPPSDEEITGAVEEEIWGDPGVSLGGIDIDTRKGVVTLEGEVDNLLARQRVADLAGTVRGVRSVVNRIEVDPYWGRSDWDIEQDAEAALLYDPATEAFEVGVDVEDNAATLTGTVSSLEEKWLAGTVVSGVRGVTAVHNELEVEPEEDRPDREIQADIEQRLLWDMLVDHALLDVRVKDGVVILDGIVGSEAEKRRAARDARVAGVESVDASDIEVERWARDPDLRADKHADKPDAAIEDAVEAALRHDPRVDAEDVRVEVDEGAVVLRGSVSTVAASRAATQDARQTVGVLRVDNRLRVVVSTPTDERLEERIEGALDRDPWVERYEVAVDVDNGVAYLDGEVDTWFERGRADYVVSRIYGITDIRNHIDVQSRQRPALRDPYLTDDDPAPFPWAEYQTWRTPRTDVEIRDDITDELWWSPYVSREQVEVSVEDGVATLTGTVDSGLERRKAVEQAWEGGATWVRNMIVVE